MSKKLKIGFTYDAKADYPIQPGDPHDKYAEFDSEATLTEITNALKSSGHEVERIGNAKNLIKLLGKGHRWDIVFNICEGLKGRNRESQVPAILEVFDIPYVGSDALTMGVTLDKAVAKLVVAASGVLTPRFIQTDSIEGLKNFDLQYPVIVKPSQEGTSKGLCDECVCGDIKSVEKMLKKVVKDYSQPALIEEFIVGQEFTVAVVGNDKPQALEPVQIAVMDDVNLGMQFYTHVRVENNEITYHCPSKADKSLLEKLKAQALVCYKALGLKDFARIDIRVSEDSIPYFLECNPLPSLGLVDVFPLIARAEGMTYEEIIIQILDFGIKRNGLN